MTFDEDSIRIRMLSGASEDVVIRGGFLPWWGNVTMDPNGTFLIGTRGTSPIQMIPLDGSPGMVLPRFEASGFLATAAFDPERNLVATAAMGGEPADKVIQLGRLGSESVFTLGPAEDAGTGSIGGYDHLRFLAGGDLLSCGDGGVRRWDIETGDNVHLVPESCSAVLVAQSGNVVVSFLFTDGGMLEAVILDPTTGQTRPIEGLPKGLTAADLSPDGRLLAASTRSGTIYVVPLSGGESHQLYGHQSRIMRIAFSTDGRQLASSDRSGLLRVWAVPDTSKPPPHSLPLSELLAKMDSLTNLRMIRDDGMPNGWRTKVKRFPGWQSLPDW